MNATITPSYSIDPEAKIRGYRRILSMSAYMQRLIDPKLLDEARIWMLEAGTVFCV